MRTFLLFLIIITLSGPVAAHPGKTDRHGGHQCLKDCAEWDLYYREYHTHDKDGKPVKVERKRSVPPTAAAAAPVVVEAVPVAKPPVEVTPKLVAAASLLPVESDASVLPWLLLALCLLLFLAVRRRVRNVEDRS